MKPWKDDVVDALGLAEVLDDPTSISP